MSDDAVRKVDRADITYAYHIALGREPESHAVVAELMRHAGQDWLTGFFTSGEFIEKVRRKLERGLEVTGEFFDKAPTADVVAWASRTIILDDLSRTAILNARSWHGLFTHLFSDERFVREVLHEELDTRFIEKLHSKAIMPPIKGEIESASASEIRGWAINQDDPVQALVIDLHIDGEFVATAPAALLRRDLQDRFGGDGRYGFILRFGVSSAGPRFREARLIERNSGAPVATVMLDFSPAASHDVAMALRAEIGLLRSALERIEGRLPALTLAMGFSLAAYDDYFRAYYRHLPGGDRSRLAMAIIVDGVGATTRELGHVLRSIEALDDDPSELILLYDGTTDQLLLRAMLEPIEGRIACRLIKCGIDDVDRALTGAIGEGQATGLLVVRPDGALAPDALAAFAHALDEGAGLAFADDDRVGLGDGGLRHYDPRLRSAFDAELALQVDWIGSQFAVSRDLAVQLGWRSDTGEARHQDFVLRAGKHLPRERIRHLSRVLFHRTPSASDQVVGGRLQSVNDLLASSGSAAAVRAEPGEDLLGATVPGALRIRYDPPEGTTATIIIPTRDQAELLEGCIGSILQSLAANRASVNILIVDNGSEQPETFALLDRLRCDDRIRVVQHDGPFNWALINNRAAEIATGDVLIFLNNDIVVLNHDCWDVLCGQAMRPDVGAVGARLLYEDGTIQHVGMVLGDWNAYLTHEGVGALGSDSGYMGRHALVREVAGVTGACLATRRDVFVDAGGFDAVNFPVECNDTDYCLRLQSLGYRILYEPNATLYHFESKSRGFNLTQEARERAFRATQCLRERWEKRFPADHYFNPHFDRISPPFTKLVPPPQI